MGKTRKTSVRRTNPPAGFTIEDGVLKSYVEKKGVTHVVIPDGVKEIGNRASRFCVSMTDLTIPDSVTVIGVGAFVYCRNLTHVTMPAGITKMDEWAFWNCPALRRVDIGGCRFRMLPGRFGEVDFNLLLQMAKHREVPDGLPEPLPLFCALNLFLQDGSDKAAAYLRTRGLEAVKAVIDMDDSGDVAALLEAGGMVAAEDVRPLLDYVIAHTQAGGNIEIQVYVTGYLNRHFPDAADPLAGLSLD